MSGWVEYRRMPENTTHIAYVQEDGEVYLPEYGWKRAGSSALLEHATPLVRIDDCEGGAEAMTTDKTCGGCQGLGAHQRWCITLVGRAASMLGPWAEQLQQWGDRIGGIPGNEDTANTLYRYATVIETRAVVARLKFQEER